MSEGERTLPNDLYKEEEKEEQRHRALARTTCCRTVYRALSLLLRLSFSAGFGDRRLCFVDNPCASIRGSPFAFLCLACDACVCVGGLPCWVRCRCAGCNRYWCYNRIVLFSLSLFHCVQQNALSLLSHAPWFRAPAVPSHFTRESVVTRHRRRT